jgi:F0F1-type ATP synthase assembly protein I
MWKILLKYTLFLIINLIIFLAIWYWIDTYFDTRPKFIIVFLVLSIINLIIFSQSLIRKNLIELNKIKWVKK